MMRNRSNKKTKMKKEERRQIYHSSRSQKNTRTKERARKIGRGGIGERGKESRTHTDTDGDVVRRGKI